MLEGHWKLEIDKVTEKFIVSFGSLTESKLNYKPDPNVWSIAQNIAHLILLNNSYFQNFDEIKKGNHVLPSIEAMDEFVTDSLQTLRPYTREDRPKTANTWDIWQPSRENFGLEILKDFTNHQSIFKMHIEALQAFFPHPTFIKYPGEAELTFRLEDCINFLIEHENRHWTQAHEVKQYFDQPVKNGR
jgi:uncharacterized damage-inducible protein DinB